MGKKIAAFFDLDGTLYRDSLLIELFKKMVTGEIIAMEKWSDDVKPAFTAWDRRVGDYDTYLARVVDVFRQSLKGLSCEHIIHYANRVIEQKGGRVYQFTRGEIERHLAEGHYVIAISGSPEELVSRMAAKYHFTDWRGAIYKTDEKGYYTGEIIPMWDSDSKRRAIYEMVEKYDLDLDQCYSYGDTNGDLTMLSMTGHPYAMNPSRELIQNIRADEELSKRAKVIVERKDVIYHIDINNLDIIKPEGR